ncbi:MAG: hypothetical protein ACREDE_03465 [Thermoplasmata archaeon]
MGGAHDSTTGRRYRRARRLRAEDRGVVAVIGTLLALLVFFALFGIFLTQYVPLWMTDNESLFTAQAATSFAQFKGAVDSQYFLDGPQSYGTPFTISSAGVPLIAQPTQGTLDFLPSTCPGGFFSKTSNPVGHAGNVTGEYGQPVNPSYCVFANVTESVGPGGSLGYSQSIPTGTLEFLLPNRYYTPETFYYEDDAVIQSQSSGYQLMAFPPPLNVSVVGANTTVSDTLLQLYGNASTVVGQGSSEVYSALRFSQFVTSNGAGSPFSFTFEIGTQYPCAWSPYLYSILKASGLPSVGYSLQHWFQKTESIPLSATFPGSPSSCFNVNGATTILSFTISSVSYAQLYLAGVQVSLGVGSVT